MLVPGGLSTIIAGYMARARGSPEPELSLTRTKNLSQFIRESEAFQLDYGHLHGVEHNQNPGSEGSLDEGTQVEKYLDARLEELRVRLEEMLGPQGGETQPAEQPGNIAAYRGSEVPPHFSMQMKSPV